MYSKENIIEIIKNDGQYIDAFMLDAFIKNWKIDAIYEDENGVDFFDDEALEKIKNGIAPKEYHEELAQHDEIPQEQNIEQQQTNENCAEVQYETIEPQKYENPAETSVIVSEPQIVEPSKNCQEPEIKNVTLDITNQTLGVLAEAIAGKITADIAKFIKNTDFLEEAMNMGAFKKDNEILAKKVQEIINDNKVLVAKIQELESQKDDYIKVFGNIYVKKNSK